MAEQDRERDDAAADATVDDDRVRVADVAAPTPEDDHVARLLAHTIDVGELAGAVERQEPADAADTLEILEDEDALDVLEQMEEQAAAEALAEMQTPLAVSVIEDLIAEQKADYAGRLLELMAPDDAADLLQALPQSDRRALLAVMAREPAEELVELTAYDPETAGGLMTTEFIALRENMTVEQAIEFIRSIKVPETAEVALVTNDDDRLVGILGLRRLLLARRGERIAELMDPDVEAVRPDLDREAVARTFDRYDLSALSVVDANDRLLGLITVDDVIDIIREEQTEDVQMSVGAGKGEMVYSSLREKFRGRLPWLMVNLVTSLIAAVVVLQFDDLISELAILAVLMPVIANQAGNAGQQSLAVTLRGIVLGEVRAERIWPLLLREACVGFVSGLVAGLLVGAVVAFTGSLFNGTDWRLGAVAAISMTGALGIGCFVGSSMPLLMRRMGFDPATGSTIFLTMTTDTMSFFIFLGLARVLAGWLLPAGA